MEIYAYRDRAQTEAMIGYLRAVGIRANLRFVQPAAGREARRAGKVAMDHWTWGTGIQDVYSTTSVFFGGNPDDMNRDPEVRALLERGDTSLDPAVRKEAYAKALALHRGARLRAAPVRAAGHLHRQQGSGVHGLSGRDTALLGDELEVSRRRRPEHADGNVACPGRGRALKSRACRQSAAQRSWSKRVGGLAGRIRPAGYGARSRRQFTLRDRREARALPRPMAPG